jgi:hypothetical protein
MTNGEKIFNEQVFNEKIISKTSILADESVENMIINHIISQYEKDEKKVFKSNLSDDDKIDSYLFWKSNLIAIIVTLVETETSTYTLYSGSFFDDENYVFDLHYVLFRDTFIEAKTAN